MLQKMLDMQSESSKASSEMQMKLMMASLEAQKEASSRIEKAHEKTAESAEKWNEKSIDAISKVAISASGKSRMNENDKSGASKKQCGVCNGVLSDGAKFCIECGTKVP
jgi:hypothetical protein